MPASGLSSLALDLDARTYAFGLLKVVFVALDNREDLSLLHTYAVRDHQLRKSTQAPRLASNLILRVPADSGSWE